MRHDCANTLRRAAKPIVSFECTGCERIHFKVTEPLPENWSIEIIDEEEHAFCQYCTAERAALRSLGLSDEVLEEDLVR
ncbi:hypothetical protein [Novosphingobium mangrovi (ex Hu et al. 2023)]|uniref:Cytoplasmic protein n=1 Tax=Novosphingobium mangrovi (ex Hu et al. 2023) TaxID=2930094 RepID=A0ABT0A8U9_9SPHN|nr:hypothetical protein [Novosphingobium mangrovi (ex Hu et al. 2023)]MCJ1959625.1 hypothetical protein [Novosphingobium mangrovi (ex Hu et al. 2023)]